MKIKMKARKLTYKLGQNDKTRIQQSAKRRKPVKILALYAVCKNIKFCHSWFDKGNM